MKTKTLVLLLIGAFSIGFGLTVLGTQWIDRADDKKKVIEDSITTLNQQLQAERNRFLNLTYVLDSISKTGDSIPYFNSDNKAFSIKLLPK